MTRWLRARMIGDRALALVLVVVMSPVIGALAVAVRLADRGQAFVAVPRVGRGGHIFKMWKLRSMRVESDDGRANGLSLTAANDTRITPVGRRLRAYHLDELPQLWNVVRGEMCLLGARPEAPEFVDLTDPRWQQVLAAPPGIAGPTQLVVADWERHLITRSAAGHVYVDEVLPVKLAIDGWYTSSASPRLDTLVALTLLRRFMPGTGSYTLKRLVLRKVPEARTVNAEAARTTARPETTPDRPAPSQALRPTPVEPRQPMAVAVHTPTAEVT